MKVCWMNDPPPGEMECLRDGFSRIASVEFCGDPEVSDMVVVDARALGPNVPQPRHEGKTVIVDYRDQPLVDARACRVYFKRSVVHRELRAPYVRVHDRPVMPITFACREEYYEARKLPESERDVDVACMFNPAWGDGDTRLRGLVAGWLKSHSLLREGRHFWVEPVGHAGQEGRTSAQMDYFNLMQRAKIVVTIGPNSNEGDFRFWEALMSGALVVSDRLHTPLPVPLLDREDVVFLDFFDPKKVGHDDRSFRDLDDVLDFYLSSHEERLKVARSGYQKAVDHHRWVSRAQYMVDVFRSTPVPA